MVQNDIFFVEIGENHSKAMQNLMGTFGCGGGKDLGTVNT